MIEPGMHTDNWRTLSGSFETACETAARYDPAHIEFAAIHGRYFITAMGYDPGISLESNPRALKRYLDEKGLRVSQIDGSYPMMRPIGSSRGGETGIACSEVPIGGVNSDNISKCIACMKETGWNGAISIECNGADENIKGSLEFLRGLLAE